ncbi:unnamed protein product [Cyclocybe aegerita]|uniref:DUF6535 domain-containing protein n=1 Tax=Cyclocybe aegerita TaxID=1973307 RepID=A0A8S0XPS6_CYCAE|nr:unnamed protein product [Cyclocybe aegerita]
MPLGGEGSSTSQFSFEMVDEKGDGLEDPNKPKMWKTGQQYHYPIPKPAGDPFDRCLEPLLTTDQIQCDVWKGEVQNLLIFAGLFSAVVTAFLVESYKLLQPDKGDLSITYLAHISARLDNLANATAFPPASITEPNSNAFSPSSSSTRVNILWFLSLVLSLATVLIGIVCLQWLREHQRYPQTLTQKEAFALFHMRSESLRKWYVPQIFAGLPLLLQLALIFFLAGIIDFLQAIDKTVAIPVIVFVSLTLCFFLVTTILPVFQSYTLALPLNTNEPEVSTPCAYKSPQAWALLRLLTLSRPLFLFIHSFILNSLISPIYIRYYLFKHGGNKKDFTSSASSWAIYKLFGHSIDWIRYELGWLEVRTCHIHGSQDWPPSQKFDWAEDYDATRGIVEVIRQYSFNEPLMYAAYHCFQKTVSHSLVTDKCLLQLFRDQITTRALYEEGAPVANSELILLSSLIRPSFEILNDEKAYVFLEALPSRFTADARNIFGQHRLEISTRLLQFLFAVEPEVQLEANPLPPSDAFELARKSQIFASILPGHHKHFGDTFVPYREFLYQDDSDLTVAQTRFTILEQRLLTLCPFFRRAASRRQTLKATPTNFHMRPFTDIYMEEIANTVWFVLTKSASSIYRRLSIHLLSCNNFLDELLNKGEHKHLYYSAQLYIKSFYTPLKILITYFNPSVFPDATLVHSVAKLVRTLDSYRIMMDPETFRSIHAYEREVEAQENGSWNDFLSVIRQAEHILDNPDGPRPGEPPDTNDQFRRALAKALMSQATTPKAVPTASGTCVTEEKPCSDSFT